MCLVRFLQYRYDSTFKLDPATTMALVGTLFRDRAICTGPSILHSAFGEQIQQMHSDLSGCIGSR